MQATVRKFHLPLLLGFVLWLILAGAVQGAVVNLVSGVSPSRVALARNTQVVATWQVESFNLSAGDRIISTQGRFLSPLSGGIIGTVSKGLTRTVKSSDLGMGNSFITLTEAVQVPASIVYRAQKLGLNSFIYQRDFYDTENPSDIESGSVTLHITGAGSAGLGINRQEIRFDDGSSIRRLLSTEPLTALTQLNYSGSGLLKGVWELATPSTTYGEPVYRRLANVRRFLGAGGQVLLTSPALETRQPGRYLVRFRIEEPGTEFNDLSIEYFVAQEAATVTPLAPIDLVLDTPLHGTYLHPDTRFSWRQVPGAQAYQLEFYSQPATREITPEGLAEAGQFTSGKHPGTLTGPPEAGALLPASQTRLSLSEVTRGHLQPAQFYWWRVLAIGKNGQVVSQSPVREIRLP